MDPAAAHRWRTCRVPHPDAPGLGDLVAEPGAFLADDLFRRAVCSPQAQTGRDPACFTTVEQIWSDLLDRHQRTPTFRLVRDGATLPTSSFCRNAGIGHHTINDVVQPNRVVEHYQAGATLVVQGLQLTDPHLGRFTNNLALALDHPVQINAYLTPAAAKGLELHFDFHDVFVVQLDGFKRWRIWEPLARTELPVRDGAKPPMPGWDEVGEPLLDLTLAPGDCLYLPRGFPHCAETVESASAHLTVGLMARTWQQAVRHALDEALIDPELRRALPAGSLGEAVADGPSLDAIGAALDPATVRRWLVEETWHRQPATRRRPLVAPTVTLDAPVSVTPGPLLWLDDGDAPDRITLGLGDRSLDLPAEAYDLLAALFEQPDGFVAGSWDGGLDPDSRLVVLRRLAAEGVVVPDRSG